jgi:hypothetical protein
MMKDDYMGETGNMVIANGLSQLYTGARDVDPYSAFDDVLDADGGVADIDFSEFRSGATRRARKRVRNTRDGGRGARRSGRTRSSSTRGGRTRSRTGIQGKLSQAGDSIRGGFKNWRDQRNKQAEQQQALIAQAQKSAPTVDQLNALLAPSVAPVATENTKMSPALKWGLIIGGVAVAGVVGYLVFKRMKNKGK